MRASAQRSHKSHRTQWHYLIRVPALSLIIITHTHTCIFLCSLEETDTMQSQLRHFPLSMLWCCPLWHTWIKFHLVVSTINNLSPLLIRAPADSKRAGGFAHRWGWMGTCRQAGQSSRQSSAVDCRAPASLNGYARELSITCTGSTHYIQATERDY